MRFDTSIQRTGLATLLLTAMVLLPGCQSARIKSAQGYIVDETLVASIQPGVDNRDSVQKTLGRPTWASQFDAGEWYYISRNTTQLAFLTPQATGESIIIVSFDPRGGVTKVERDGLNKVISVKMEKDKTPTKGRENSLLNDIFGNIGKFSGTGTGGGDAPSGRDGPK